MIRTLVVEDDARVAEVHAAYVARLPGFELAGVAHRGVEALELIAARPVDLVLLDFHLPDVTGLALCRALRRRAGQPVDVIGVTAARDVETVRSAVAEGVVQYIVKPFSFATFRDKLERYAIYRERLAGRTDASQQEVDELLGTLRGSAAAPLPKGLSQQTFDLLADALRAADGERSAQDVAEATGVSRVTARRYLETMASQGLVELTMRYGATGRPEHRYRWASAQTRSNGSA